MHDHVIGSMDRLKQEEHLSNLLQAEPWDLVIFDEGHQGLVVDSMGKNWIVPLVTPSPPVYAARQCICFCSAATPHQGMQDKFIALLELLRPERSRGVYAARSKTGNSPRHGLPQSQGRCD